MNCCSSRSSAGCPSYLYHILIFAAFVVVVVVIVAVVVAAAAAVVVVNLACLAAVGFHSEPLTLLLCLRLS